VLWSIAVDLSVIVGWFAALFTGQVPQWVHNFVSRFVRYYTHVSAFVVLAANPFPGFTGIPGTYPVDAEIEQRAIQNRWKTGFRIILAIPALAVSGGLGGAMFVAALLGWFAALATGRMPRNLRQAQVLALRYGAQVYAYVLLLTDRYPFASPAPPASSAPIP
jgi:cytochrome bd-type quinol oxidase subunit 1